MKMKNNPIHHFQNSSLLFTPLKNFISRSLFLFVIIGFSQQKTNLVTDKFIENNPYLHLLQVEKFFLHTNKSVYYPGEKVWFKAYVVNDTDNKPSLNTTNLHVNLYNSNKELVSNHLFLVQNGLSNGQIELKDSLITGKYYIELTTQWNQNFKNNASITAIDVINNSLSIVEESPEFVSTNEYEYNLEKDSVDVQFFPESGTLLENIQNTISFKSNSGLISGDVIDNETGIVVAKMKSNEFGMGKFVLYARPNRSYTAYINRANIQKHVALPKTELNGYVLSKENIQNDDTVLKFILKTNELTIKSSANEYVFAVLHRNGMQNVVVPIKLKKKYVNYSFNILKSSLFNGVNSLTLFNKNNTPIAEYSFFNDNSNGIQLNVSKLSEEKDSIAINFETRNTNSNTNVSISILPENTRIYKNELSIKTAFLLAPYLESTYSNLNAIIESNKREQNIDLLVQTGIKKSALPYKKKPTYQKNNIVLAEKGMTIKGNVSSNVKFLGNYKVLLSSDANEILLIDSIGENNSFAFYNLYLEYPTDYQLALLDPNGQIIKTGFRLSKDLISYNPLDLLQKRTETINSVDLTGETGLDYSSLPILEDMNVLDEVFVSAYQKQKSELEESGVELSVYENGFSEVFMVDERKNPTTIFHYLQKLPGIDVVGDAFRGFKIFSTRGKRSIIGSAEMAIILDNIVMYDTESLLGMMADEFVAVSINSSGAALGLRGQNGYVSFYTKIGKFQTTGGSLPNPDIIRSETEFGFEVSIEYKNSLMHFANELSREYYGTVDWIPNLNITRSPINQLKFEKNGFRNFKLIVNGINEDGEMVFDIVNIKSNSN